MSLLDLPNCTQIPNSNFQPYLSVGSEWSAKLAPLTRHPLSFQTSLNSALIGSEKRDRTRTLISVASFDPTINHGEQLNPDHQACLMIALEVASLAEDPTFLVFGDRHRQGIRLDRNPLSQLAKDFLILNGIEDGRIRMSQDIINPETGLPFTCYNTHDEIAVAAAVMGDDPNRYWAHVTNHDRVSRTLAIMAEHRRAPNKIYAFNAYRQVPIFDKLVDMYTLMFDPKAQGMLSPLRILSRAVKAYGF